MKKVIFNNLLEVQEKGLTRSLRGTSIVKSDVHLINCHCCKTVDLTVNLITCSLMDCRESFCINCIKKTYLKFNPSFFLILKEKENNKKYLNI
jgi:hypothetical protein